MKAKKIKLMLLQQRVDEMINKAVQIEQQQEHLIKSVHPNHRAGALNLIHYLSLRTFKLAETQQLIYELGFPDITGFNAHTMWSLLNLKQLIECSAANHTKKATDRKASKAVSLASAAKNLRKNTCSLFGKKPRGRRTRIMVTMPQRTIEDEKYVRRLVKAGMDIARINCAHDEADDWRKMVENIRKANEKSAKPTLVSFDLAGPKIRTGAVVSGPDVVRVKPGKDELGAISKPAKLWLAPSGQLSPQNDYEAHLPVDELFMSFFKKGDRLLVEDARKKLIDIEIIRKNRLGFVGQCDRSAYITSGSKLTLIKSKTANRSHGLIGEIMPLKQYLTLKTGDLLRLDKAPVPGENAVFSEAGELISHAHISCTYPAVFELAKPGQTVFFDDGKIEAKIEELTEDYMLLKIKGAKDRGSKLAADKGINFPEIDIHADGLTEKDQNDLKTISDLADIINLSFVNRWQDVEAILEQFKALNISPGLVLKIETAEGVKNLPEILLHAMRYPDIGLMIARGDLAVETGWKGFYHIQEEIIRLCEAAYIPAIWATQVLESLSKNNVPTRAEIIDAASAQKLEAIMLNKGNYVHSTIRLLSQMLRKSQYRQKYKEIGLKPIAMAVDLKPEKNDPA